MNIHEVPKQTYHTIYEFMPIGDEESRRLVERFESKDDAEYVLNALLKVNVLFNCYRIVEEVL